MSNRLDSLDQSRIDWSITVRVSRMWPSFGNNVHFVNILLDAENYHVHAFVNQTKWNGVANNIMEGQLYQITNFHVRPATGLLRPVSSPMYLILTQSIVIQPLPTDPISPIPMHKFELIQIGELYDIANFYLPRERPTYAIDIAGQVQNLQPIRIIQTFNGEKLMIRFMIYDGRHSVNVAFWDEDVEILDSLVHGIFETPPVVILASMRARVYQGSLELRSLSHSRIFINIDYDAVHQLRQRLNDDVSGSPADDM